MKNWRDVAYISFGCYSALGVKNNGEVLCEKLSYSSYSQGELSAYQNLIDNNITLQAVQGIINDGKLYLRYPDKKATYSVEDGKFAWEIEYHEFEDVVWSDRGCNVAIDIYGQDS